MSTQLGSLMVREKLRSTILDNRILRGVSEVQEAYEEKNGETYICKLT